MPGKTHVERSFRILFDDSGGTARDLTGDLIPGSVQGGGLTFDEVDVTGVSEKVRNYLAGHAEAPITAQFWLNDTATTGAYTVLTGQDGSDGMLTMQWGENGAAPDSGDPEWEGEYLLVQCSHTIVNGAAALQVRFVPFGSTAPAWGTVS